MWLNLPDMWECSRFLPVGLTLITLSTSLTHCHISGLIEVKMRMSRWVGYVGGVGDPLCKEVLVDPRFPQSVGHDRQWEVTPVRSFSHICVEL